ncbi:hypothetical protein PHYPSEUDO_014387 [Phytophthora pseudosyringae]|uniref:Uncharacterized protein n=1 Tax=Phytophthora pseudosyringae TaxID=221518 RepID=A0A8T1W5E5_9STRA|nr:hypothetical protein PHYPSEUDO_014387 [Phytophthora pseudosyringae]
MTILLHVAVVFAAIVAFTAPTAAVEDTSDQPSRTAANWPALRFLFTLKRSSMNIFGQSDFSMFSNPVLSDDGSNVLYESFASFTENKTRYNYTFVDGAAFISRTSVDSNTAASVVTCLGSESGNLPPVNAIVAAVNEATAVSGGGSSYRCSTGSSYKILVNRTEFILCRGGVSDLTMYGADMNIAVDYLNQQVSIVKPAEESDTLSECKTSVPVSLVTPVGKSLLTERSSSSSEKRKLKAEFDFTFWSDDSDEASQASSDHSGERDPGHQFCSCKSAQRACIFIHGMGIDKEEPANVDSFSYYWGNLTDHAPCCSSIKYAVLDTVNNSWTNDTQQYKVCDRALAVSETSTVTVVKDTIIVTHSMGNLMLAGAIASGKCSLDSTTSWVGLAGPMKGSMGSDFVQASCAGETNTLLEQVAEITGKCPPSTALMSLAYQGERFSSTEHNAAYTAAQEAYTTNVTALMCSAGYSGVHSLGCNPRTSHDGHTDDAGLACLRFNFTLHRSGMKVHDQSEFSVYADPTVLEEKNEVLYNDFVTFMENKAILNYTLVDGVSYLSTTRTDSISVTPVKCLDVESETIPSINSIVAAINEATAV